MNSSQAERFENLYRRLWVSFHSPDTPDLSQHERELLHHVPASSGVPLTWIARHLALAKSTTSVLLKDLERRGFVRRTRDRADERRLAIVLTSKGRRRVEQDTVLDVRRLAPALAALPAAERRALLASLERLANAGGPERARSGEWAVSG